MSRFHAILLIYCEAGKKQLSCGNERKYYLLFIFVSWGAKQDPFPDKRMT